MTFSESALVAGIVARRLKLDNDFPINYSFFAVMSHDLAYFLGFVAGDGYIRPDGTGFMVGSTDKEIIELFKSIVAPNHKLEWVKSGYHPGNGYWKLGVRRAGLCKMMVNYDVKSPSIFQRIPSEFIYSFIRGFFDSDGCLYTKRQKTCLAAELGFSQKSKEYIESLRNVLLSLGYFCSNVRRTRNIWVINLTHTSSMSLLGKLYTNKGKFYLQRKYDIYRSVLASRASIEVKKTIDHYSCYENNALVFA